jgi:hypothetical protein
VTTTAIFAELLVCGLETLVWLVFLTCVITGRHLDAAGLAPLKDWSALVTILIVAASYAVGTVSDRLADAVFGKWDEYLRRKKFADDDQVGLARLRIAQASEPLAKYLEYIRSRMRLARATSFNAALFCLVSILAGTTRFLSGPPAATSMILSILVAGLAAYSWSDSCSMFYRRLAQSQTLLENSPEEHS